MMDLPAEKYRLIEWLISVEDEDIIRKIQKIKKETLDPDQSYKISDPEKLFIEAGLKDIEEGNTFTHEDVIKEVKEKYGI